MGMRTTASTMTRPPMMSSSAKIQLLTRHWCLLTTRYSVLQNAHTCNRVKYRGRRVPCQEHEAGKEDYTSIFKLVLFSLSIE